MSQRVLSLVPARGGSKGIPRKNLRELGDKPLVAHAITTSEKAENIDAVALTTDSQEISQVGRQYNVDHVIDRPSNLATDEVPLAPVVKHGLKQVDGKFDYVLCFQPTTPLITPSTIDHAIDVGITKGNNSLIFVRDSTHHYWKVTGDDYIPVAEDRKNRQWMNTIYEEIGLFLTHRDLVKEGRRVGTDPVFQEVESGEGIDIDSYEDWLLAEAQLGRKKLVYRVAGDGETGSGHVYRGITIADNLFKHNVIFAAEQSDDLAIEKLKQSNYEYHTFRSDQSFRKFIHSNPPDVIVNDILDTEAEYIKELKTTGARVINFEDVGEGTEYADAVINALYEYSNPPENHYFGYEYFCLRNEFRYATPHPNIKSVKRVMVSFGGADENNLTAKTLRALQNLDQEVELDVVLGLGYTKQETLDPIIEEIPQHLRINISQNVKSMAAHMEKADLLITSNGRTLYEAAALNLPTISIAQNHREQKHPYAHVSRGVVMLGQAEYINENTILTAVEEYINNQQEREKMRRALADHDIANGINRIKSILFNENDGY